MFRQAGGGGGASAASCAVSATPSPPPAFEGGRPQWKEGVEAFTSRATFPRGTMTHV